MYTKILIAAVMLTYFLGFAFGIYGVIVDINQLSAFLTYIGVPTSTAIAFYAWKAKSENVVKIRKGLNKEALKLQQQLARLPPERLQAYQEIKMDVDAILQELEV